MMVRLSRLSCFFTRFWKSVFFLVASTEVKFQFGIAIASGMTGNPAPEPKSMRVWILFLN